MALIIHIDTASTIASVTIARDGKILHQRQNVVLNEHAAFVQPAIKEMIQQLALPISAVDAIAVVDGPGSYTGLRVGMASAKGLAFAINKPLITIGTLPLMAAAAITHTGDQNLFYAPMIDARRQEVFTAIYNASLNVILEPCAMLLDKSSFSTTLAINRTLFFGTGASKWKLLCEHPNALYSDDYLPLEAMAKMSYDAFCRQDFAELAYSEPQYLKEFYSGN